MTRFTRPTLKFFRHLISIIPTMSIPPREPPLFKASPIPRPQMIPPITQHARVSSGSMGCAGIGMTDKRMVTVVTHITVFIKNRLPIRFMESSKMGTLIR